MGMGSQGTKMIEQESLTRLLLHNLETHKISEVMGNCHKFH